MKGSKTLQIWLQTGNIGRRMNKSVETEVDHSDLNTSARDYQISAAEASAALTIEANVNSNVSHNGSTRAQSLFKFRFKRCFKSHEQKILEKRNHPNTG